MLKLILGSIARGLGGVAYTIYLNNVLRGRVKPALSGAERRTSQPPTSSPDVFWNTAARCSHIEKTAAGRFG
jgi:hypothetical protein